MLWDMKHLLNALTVAYQPLEIFALIGLDGEYKMDFLQFASANGLVIDRLISGRIARCSTKDHPHKRNGAYFFDGDWGWVQNWQSMPEIQHWQTDRVMSNREKLDMQVRMERQKADHKAERARLNLEAAKKAVGILASCKADKHAYLAKKGLDSHIALVSDGKLCVPMNYKGEICGLQLIDEDGEKKFLYGQRTNYANFTIGNRGVAYITEGYASGLTLKLLLDTLKIPNKVIVAFSAQNLLKIAKQIDCIIIADNDKSGTGLKVAKESGRNFYMPEHEGDDINDMFIRVGRFKASQMLRDFING